MKQQLLRETFSYVNSNSNNDGNNNNNDSDHNSNNYDSSSITTTNKKSIMNVIYIDISTVPVFIVDPVGH